MGRRSLLVGLMLGTWLAMASPAYANHAGNTYNCDSFASQAAAQAHYRQHPGDQDNLDGSPENGIACDSHDYPAGSPRDETPVTRTSAPAPLVANTGTSRAPRVRIDGREYAAQCGANSLAVAGEGTQGANLTVIHTFTINCAASSGGGLPRTGQMILQWTGIGVVLVAFGWMLWAGDRFFGGARRRSAHARRR